MPHRTPPPPFLHNPRRGGLPATLLRAAILLPLWLTTLLLPWYALGWYADGCARVPHAPNILAHSNTPSGSRILASEGIRLGGIVRGHRPWISIDHIPAPLISAFVAAEDGDFFAHHGIDPRALARAAFTNLQAGRIAQGGSTISQQVAKMYVGRDRTLERKIHEAFLTRRIEQRYTKLQILEAYLNRIYLGAGAHGIAAAAEIYFARTLPELSLAQSALLAGLVSAPSRLNPYHNPSGALARRRYVLERMLRDQLISHTTFLAATAEPLELATRNPDDTRAPYLVDAARRELRSLLPNTSNTPRALDIETSASLVLQRHALHTASAGARDLARQRQDPVVLIPISSSEVPTFLRDTQRLYGRTLSPRRTYLGVVTHTTPRAARIRVANATLIVSAENLRWFLEDPDERLRELKKPREKRRNHLTLRPLEDHLPIGALVQVRPHAPALPGLPVPAEILPTHDLQAALVAIDVDSGGIRALVGGTGHDITAFNRATRGCRQPGSVFKPILYSKGFERGLTPASMIGDTPVRYEDHKGRLIWEPRNADRGFKGPLMLAAALAASRNLPSVKLLHKLGATSVVRHAQRLGIRSPLQPTPALALGASCVSPLEMTEVFGVFARRGYRLQSHLVRSVIDHNDTLLLDRGAYMEPAGPIDARLLRLAHALTQPEPRLLSSAVAYLTTYLLRQVILRGTARDARELSVPVAGKTGTTNAYDVWFIGFSRHHLTGLWLGDDRNRKALGDAASGTSSALPIWMEYMALATAQHPHVDPLRDPPDSVELHRIDPQSGLRAHPEGHGQWIPFSRGTAPQRTAPSPTQRSAAEADVRDHDF